MAFTARFKVGQTVYSIHVQGDGRVECVGHPDPAGAWPIAMLEEAAARLAAERRLVQGDPMDVETDLDPRRWRTNLRTAYLLILQVFGPIADGERVEFVGDRPTPPPNRQGFII